jgi:hypothetical protein
MKTQWAIEPTFRLEIRASRDIAISRFHTAIRGKNDHRLYMCHGEYAELHLEPENHRLWSPHLTIYFTDGSDKDRAYLMGRFAPRPNLWVLIWIFYLAFFCIIFFAGVFAGAQWLVGEFPWGLAIVIPSAILYATLFIASQIGQSLCKDQIDLLRNRLDQLLRESELEFHSSYPNT